MEMKEITKQVSDIRVLNNFSIQIKESEIHAVITDNEAGKSSLIKILSGEYPYGTYSGDIFINGDKKIFYSIKDSEASGIGVIYQKPFSVDHMSIAENILLGSEYSFLGFINKKRCIDETKKILKEMKLDFYPDTKMFELNSFFRQKIEIAKCLLKEKKLWILDDLIAILNEKEADSLLELLEYYKKSGITIIYIGPRIKDVLRIVNTVTAMKDGKSLLTEDAKNYVDSDIRISLLINNELSKMESIDSFCNHFYISKREKDVLLKLIEGKSYKDICEILFLSMNTIKTHINSIYQKVNAKNKQELINEILKFIKH
jgi:putative multiple sugar transport system ATP-binding protein